MNVQKFTRQGDHYSLTNYGGSLVNEKKKNKQTKQNNRWKKKN